MLACSWLARAVAAASTIAAATRSRRADFRFVATATGISRGLSRRETAVSYREFTVCPDRTFLTHHELLLSQNESSSSRAIGGETRHGYMRAPAGGPQPRRARGRDRRGAPR